MNIKSRNESAALFNPTLLRQTRESELCKSGVESKAGPNQWVCLWELSEVEIHRNLDCPNYDKCVNTAADKMWEGFSCSTCSKFKKEP